MRLVMAMPTTEALADAIGVALGARRVPLETRRFPDGESYVRLLADVAGAELFVVCSLVHPDEQFLRLVFAARVAWELGATRVTLVAPYLAYMRQDKRFHPGEAVTSRYFADLISREFDGIVTVDPHLHRYSGLGEIYAIPAMVLHAAPLLGDWIAAEVADPLIIGPDAESEQWVSAVAARAAAPHVVLRKDRRGDRDVEIVLPDLARWRDRTAVLLDDIASSGRTMIGAAEGLLKQGMRKPVSLVVHALFEEGAFARLSAVTSRIVSTDTVAHSSNGISVAQLLAGALRAA